MNVCKKEGYYFKMDVIPQQVINNIIKWTQQQKKQHDDDMIQELNELPLKLRSSMYKFQKEGFKFAIKKGGRCLIADEMGLGKSIQAIAIAYYYRKDWPLLIVVPSSLTLTWKYEILKWLNGKINDDDINIIKTCKDKILKYNDNCHLYKPLCLITIISYGLAVRKQAELSDNKSLFGMIICDESHSLKNHKTQRCKILLPIIKKCCKRAILLSGTPTNNRPSEIYTQIDALRPNEFMSFKQFTIRYCEGQQGKFGWQANGAMHLKELHSMIKYRVMIRRLKCHVLTQLPQKIRRVITIQCDKTLEKKIQQKMEKDLNLKEKMDDDHDFDVFDQKNKNMMYLYSLTGQSKIKGIKEYIFDLYESGEKFLIFGHHIDVLDGIQDCVENKCKTGFIRIDGKTESNNRQLLVNKFQNNDNIRIGILSITAAGTGLTLTAATSVVFAELYWGPTALLQCEDRAHRISQKNIVNIIYLLGKKSLDDKMWPMINKKMQHISQALSGKNIKMQVKDYQNQYQQSSLNHNNNNNHNIISMFNSINNKNKK